MKTGTKVSWTIVTLVVGAFAFGVIRDTLGHGQFFLTLVEVSVLFYIWKRPSSSPFKRPPAANLPERPLRDLLSQTPTEAQNQPAEAPLPAPPPVRMVHPTNSTPDSGSQGTPKTTRPRLPLAPLIVVGVVVLAVLIVAAVFVSPLIGIFRHNEQRMQKLATFSVGDRVVLRSDSHSWVLGAASHQDYDDFLTAGMAHNIEATSTMTSSGKVFYIPNNTQALIRDISNDRLIVEYKAEDSRRSTSAVVLVAYVHHLDPTLTQDAAPSTPPPSESEEPSNLEILIGVTRQINQNTPVDVDEATVLLAVDYAADQIIYRYELDMSRMGSSSVPIIASSLEQAVTETACHEPKMAFLWKRSISARYRYESKGGQPIADFTVTPADCGY